MIHTAEDIPADLAIILSSPPAAAGALVLLLLLSAVRKCKFDWQLVVFFLKHKKKENDSKTAIPIQI